MISHTRLLLLTLALAGGSAHAGPTNSFVNFDTTSGGAQGWKGMQSADGIGGTLIDPDFGLDAPALRTMFNNFYIAWWNNTNSHYLGDWGEFEGVTISLDVFATYISFLNTTVTRDLMVEFRDYDNTPPGIPYVSVWYNLGTLDASKGWQNLSVTIVDTQSTSLPAGWGGTGDYLGTGLPAGRTFADVLASVDLIGFSTGIPGMVSGFVDYDVAIDNIKVTAVPEPSTYALLLGGLSLVGWMKRRQSPANQLGVGSAWGFRRFHRAPHGFITTKRYPKSAGRN